MSIRVDLRIADATVHVMDAILHEMDGPRHFLDEQASTAVCKDTNTLCPC